jgi:hypothetical protein
MAKQTTVVITDDLDGTEGASTVSFGLDGQSYEIDLSDKNAEKLRKALKPFLDNATRVTSVKAGKRSKASRTTSNAADVRAWARENGYAVPERGRIPSEIREAYESADK